MGTVGTHYQRNSITCSIAAIIIKMSWFPTFNVNYSQFSWRRYSRNTTTVRCKFDRIDSGPACLSKKYKLMKLINWFYNWFNICFESKTYRHLDLIDAKWASDEMRYDKHCKSWSYHRCHRKQTNVDRQVRMRRLSQGLVLSKNEQYLLSAFWMKERRLWLQRKHTRVRRKIWYLDEKITKASVAFIKAVR